MTDPMVDPYPSEMPKIKMAFAKLERIFVNTPMNDSTVNQFHQAAAELFGEAGFEVDVAWDEVRQGGVATGLYLPEITISGRVEKLEETDHDRLKTEIQAGLADGKKGVVDPNTGEWREEPRSKTIT